MFYISHFRIVFFSYIFNKISKRFYYEENGIYNIEIRIFVLTNLAKHEKSVCFFYCIFNKYFLFIYIYKLFIRLFILC